MHAPIQNERQHALPLLMPIVGALIVLALLGYGMYQLYRSSVPALRTTGSSPTVGTATAAASSQPAATPEPQPSSSPSSGLFLIKDWGVGFKLPPSLSDLEYATRNNGSSAVFSTQQLVASAPSCNPANLSYLGIGALVRSSKGGPAPADSSLITTINGYDYYYQSGPTCVTNQSGTAETLWRTVSTDYATAVKGLVASQAP